MNDDEQQLLKAGADAIARPFQELLLKLLGPSFEEIGGIGGDFWRHYRSKLDA
jgi:hypothetical protein